METSDYRAVLRRRAIQDQRPTCERCKWWMDLCKEAAPGWKACGRAGKSGGLVASCEYDHVVTAPDFGCVQFEAKA